MQRLSHKAISVIVIIIIFTIIIIITAREFMLDPRRNVTIVTSSEYLEYTNVK